MAKRLAVLDVERCVGCQACRFACARRMGEGGLAAACIGVRSAGGVRRGYVVIVCRACADPPCARVCPTDALIERGGSAASSGGVRLKPELCIGCGNCVQACPFGAVFWNAGENKPQIWAMFKSPHTRRVNESANQRIVMSLARRFASSLIR